MKFSFIASAFIDGEYHDDFDVFYDPNETVRDVKMRCEEMLGLKLLDMTHRGNSMKEDSCIIEYCPQIVDFSKIPKFKLFGCSMKHDLRIRVQPANSSKQHVLMMNFEDTVADFRSAITTKLNVLPQYRPNIVYYGKILDPKQDSRSLRSCGFGKKGDYDIVTVFWRFTGGGGTAFADVSNPDSLEIQNWSQSAPRWRVACEGLNLEGTCKNSSCVAFGKKVISKQNFCSFDICERACECPMCHKLFQPSTCAFTKCDWMYEGVKSDGSEVKGPWKQAGDQYERFKEAGNMVKWDHLTISTRPKNSVRGRKSPEPVRQEPRSNGHNDFERNQRIYDEERRESRHFQAELDRLLKQAASCDVDRKSSAADLCRDLSDLIRKRLPAIQAEAGDRCFIRVNEGRVVLEFDFHSLHPQEAVQKTDVLLNAASIIGSICCIKLKLITGRGAHSRGEAKIRPAVLSFLRNQRLFVIEEAGALIVPFVPKNF